MPATVLARITPDKDREAWLKVRRNHNGIFRIGSSDAPVIVLGEHLDRSPIDLWMEKRGIEDGPEDNYDMRQGRALEAVCADEAALEMQRPIHRRHGTLAHQEHEWMIADLDRVISRIHNGNRQAGLIWHANKYCTTGILECKAPRYGGMKEVQEKPGPAKATVVQVLHQLAVTGWQWAMCAYYHRDFGVLLYPIHRKDANHEELIAEIIRREQVFWECLQKGEIPPEPDDPPEIHIPEPFRDATAWREDILWQKALKKFGDAKVQKEAAEGIFEVAREDVQFLMGNMQEVQTPWGGASWKFSKPSMRLNKKRLQAQLATYSGKLMDLIAEGETAQAMTLADELAYAVENAHSAGNPSRRFLASI